MSERKRARAEDLGGGGAPVDLSGRASKQFVGAALESIERLARASGHGALLDAAGEAAIAAELTRCLARSMVERRPAVTPVALGDVFDVAELAVRILVSLPLEDRLGCARVCRGWGQSVRLDCEDERRHESKTLRSVLLRRMDAPVVQLGLFSRFPSAPVLALSRACALEKLRCDEQAGAVQERHAWNVPAAAADAAADWADFSVRSNAAGDGAEGGGERRAASAGADKAAACGAPHDPQAIVNSAGSYLMLLQQGCVRLFALFRRDWSPEQIPLRFEMPPRVTALQFYPLDNNVFAVAHAAIDPAGPSGGGGGARSVVHTIQTLTVRGAVIQKLCGFHAAPVEAIWYYRGDKGTFTFQVTQSADVVHWWRLLLDPQWPGMVHNVPARSLQLPRDAGPSIAVRLHPSGDAVVIASRRELRVHSVSGTIPSARRAMRLVTAATLQCGGGGAREATLLVAGSISAERVDQILFFDCSGLRLLRKCSLDGLPSRITAISPPEVSDARAVQPRQADSIHELAVGTERGEVVMLHHCG